MAILTKNLTPITAETLTKLDKPRTYILYFHHKASAPQTKVFEFTGTFFEAIDRGKKHCELMNYRFIKVRPFIVSFDEQEKRHNNEPGWAED